LSNVRLLCQSDGDILNLQERTRTGCTISNLQNLKDSRRGRIMRIDPSQAAVTYKFGAALPSNKYMDSLALGRIQGMPSGATITAKFYSNGSYGGTTMTKQMTYTRSQVPFGTASDGTDTFEDLYSTALSENIFFYLSERFRYQSFDVQIEADFGSGFANLVCDIGRMMIGRAFEPEINLSPGVQMGKVDPSEVIRTNSAGTHTISRAGYRRFQFSLEHLSENEMVILSDMLETVGKSTEIVCALDPGAEGQAGIIQSLFGKVVSDRNFTRNNPVWRQTSLTIEET